MGLRNEDHAVGAPAGSEDVMTSKDVSLLKPCPFCGCTKIGTHSERDFDDFGTYHAIQCHDCGARSRQRYVSDGNDCPQHRQEVRDDWNMRAASQVETPVVQVAGDTLPTTLAQFILRASRLLSDEQAKPNPDSALIAFLCDTVRLARENERMGKVGIPIETAPDPTGNWPLEVFKPLPPDEAKALRDYGVDDSGDEPETKAECTECVGGAYCWKCGRQQCCARVGREREMPWVAGPAEKTNCNACACCGEGFATPDARDRHEYQCSRNPEVRP